MIGVAIMIAIGELRSDFSEVTCPDWPTAQHADGFLAGRPTIHQYESHVPPPSAKQNTVSDEWEILGGGAQR